MDDCWSRRQAVRIRIVRLAASVEAINRSLVRKSPFVHSSLQLPPVDIDEELEALDRIP